MSVQVPATPSIRTLPVPSRAAKEVRVYLDYPDAQPWLAEALANAEAVGDHAAARTLRELGATALGAPHGDYVEESFRVARATGVLVGDKQTEDNPAGVALAHGRCWAFWTTAEDGEVLVLEFQSPSTFGWGAGKDRFAQEHVRATCLQQMLMHGESLLENVADPERAARLEVTFSGKWDDSTARLQERIQFGALRAWQSVLNAKEQLPGPTLH